MIASNKELVKRLDDLEKRYDAQFKVVFDAMRQLMIPLLRELQQRLPILFQDIPVPEA